MPYDLSQLDGNSATCTSPLGIAVTYRLANVTPRILRQMNEMADTEARGSRPLQDGALALVNIVHQLVIAWDVTDQGEPVPLTPEALEDVRVEILSDVLLAIVTDANGNPTTGTASRRR